jgi:hypothetical protein
MTDVKAAQNRHRVQRATELRQEGKGVAEGEFNGETLTCLIRDAYLPEEACNGDWRTLKAAMRVALSSLIRDYTGGKVGKI